MLAIHERSTGDEREPEESVERASEDGDAERQRIPAGSLDERKYE